MHKEMDAGSFRDPAGFVYRSEGILLRQVNRGYDGGLRLYHSSGLYDKLCSDGLVIPHRLLDNTSAYDDRAAAVAAPEIVPTISYPFEWSFSQLKDAALCTLDIQMTALRFGMWLKDASAYNIQFHHGRPIHIDTLSFDPAVDGAPWPAYRQFCEHFLAPLVLMSRTDVRLGQLLKVHLDGIPLDLAVHLLPASTRLSPGLAVHLYAHAAAQSRHKSASAAAKSVAISPTQRMGLIDNLRWTVSQLKPHRQTTVWGEYYADTNYSEESMQSKRSITEDLLSRIDAPKTTLWDLGANTGEFSRIAADIGWNVVAWDMDHNAVETHYLAIRQQGRTDLLPLIQDLTNPTPGFGWAGCERKSLLDRAPVGAVMALALVHHLAIGNNVPFPQIASLFHRTAPWAVVEFVDRDDTQVQRLMSTRHGDFAHYTKDLFEQGFGELFHTVAETHIPGTHRTLYLFHTR
jgi:hypothetical protein